MNQDLFYLTQLGKARIVRMMRRIRILRMRMRMTRMKLIRMTIVNMKNDEDNCADAAVVSFPLVVAVVASAWG